MDKNLIIKLEDRILQKHLIGDGIRNMHQCIYCGEESSWYVSVNHKKDCPISILTDIRMALDIPSWFYRNIRG